ncbi:MAG: hypothetical protein Q8O22_00810 [Candidatus Omnitrophota bacterium]|nr:hypothetical protein [Candidatus Omnitrophota bacterium]
MNVLFLLLIFATGASGLAAQVLLLRELLVSFNGNELAIGVIISNWVIAEAAGAFFGGRKRGQRLFSPSLLASVKKSRCPLFLSLQIFFFVSLFASLYLSRVFKQLLGVGFGEAAGLGLVIFSFVITLLPAFIHGALFSLGCSLYSSSRQEGARSIGSVYAWETFGTLAGGLCLAFFIIPWFNPFAATFILSVFVFLICLVLKRGQRLFSPSLLASVKKSRCPLFLFLVFLVYLFSAPGIVERLENNSLQRQWKGYNLLESRNSIYGNISVTSLPGQYTFYYNGLPIITTPHPDQQFVRDLGHLPLLFHPLPRDVLVVGSGAGGLLHEVLKHNAERIDYAEMDPALIRALKIYPTALSASEFSDPRVNVINLDGRFFIRTSPRNYDLILVGAASSADLSSNRMFTADFYALTAKRLKPGGVVAFWLPREEAYMGSQQAKFYASILSAFRENYRFIRVIPGDYYTIFLGSSHIDITRFTPDVLAARLARQVPRLGSTSLTTGRSGQGVENIVFPPAYLEYLLAPAREKNFLRLLPEGAAMVNRDQRPIAVFEMLAFAGKKYFGLASWLVSFMGRLGRFEVCAIVLLPFFIIPALFFRRGGAKPAILYCIATTGFFGMLASLLLMFIFQAYYGYIFVALSIFIAVFMAGAGTGAITAVRYVGMPGRADVGAGLKSVPVGAGLKPAPTVGAMIILEAAMILFCLTLPILLGSWAGAGPSTILGAGEYALLKFGLLFFLSGFFVGAQFPLAAALFSRGNAGTGLSRTADKELRRDPARYLNSLAGKPVPTDAGRVSGVLYGADLAGAWIAGAVGGVILLPVAGLFNTCLLVAILKLSSLIWFSALNSKKIA